MKLLLAVDQSRDSKTAINLLRRLTWPPESTLILLHVATIDEEKRAAPPKPVKNEKSGVTGKSIPTIHAELRRVEKLLASETLNVELMVVNGIPGQEILTLLRKKKGDIAILGSRGLSRISGLLLGSVSEWVLKDAQCSVVIGRPTARKAKSASSLHVLLATDGSPDSWKSVEMVKEIGFPVGSTITLLHVIRKHLYETDQFVDRAGKSQVEFSKLAKNLCRDRSSDGVRLLKDSRDALSSLPISIDERIALGHEAKEILKAARQEKADLIILGSKGMTGLRRFLMGSVAHTVSHHAPCSVLVVRSAKKE